MTRFLAVVALCASASFASCRYLGFENPLDCPGSESAVDPAPYVGQWEIKKIRDQPTTGEPKVVTVSGTDPCSLSFELSGDPADPEPRSGTLRLTRVAGTVVAAAKLTEIWYVLKPDLRDGGAEVGIGDPDTDAVKVDVDNGTLSGTVAELDARLSIVRVTASGTGLRSYLETRLGLFEERAVLRKR